MYMFSYQLSSDDLLLSISGPETSVELQNYSTSLSARDLDFLVQLFLHAHRHAWIHVCLVVSFSFQCHRPPGFSVHGILQVRILERAAISSSRGSYQPRDQSSISCVGRQILLPLSHPGGPSEYIFILNSLYWCCPLFFITKQLPFPIGPISVIFVLFS